MIDLENMGFVVFGLPDSGKSTLTNFILATFGATAFVYDTLNEYPGEPFDSYSPKGRADVKEFETVLRVAMNSRRYKLIMIDEANRFCPSKPATLPQAVADLNDWRAHWGLTTGFIARRPVQLHQDLTELAHYLFIFRLTGKNDIQYLNDIADGLGDAVSQLPAFHFVMVNPLREFQVMPPVPATFATAKKASPPRA